MRQEFLDAIWTAVGLWDSARPGRDPRESAVSLAFSIIMIIDGRHRNLPKYKLMVGSTNLSGSMSMEFLDLDPIEDLRQIIEEAYGNERPDR